MQAEQKKKKNVEKGGFVIHSPFMGIKSGRVAT